MHLNLDISSPTRQVLKGVGRIALIGVVGQWGGLAIGHSNASNTALAAVVPDKRFVDAAYEMQRRAIDAGDQAFGAVVGKDGRIVGDGPSRVITNHDANGTCRDGSNPRCPMCETAAYWAKVSQLYHGGAPADGGVPRYVSC